MKKSLNFIKGNIIVIIISGVFLFMGIGAGASENNSIKSELENEYTSQEAILKEKETEISSIDNEIEEMNNRLEDLQGYIESNK